MRKACKIVNDILQHDVYTEKGVLLLSKGTQMRPLHKDLLVRHLISIEYVKDPLEDEKSENKKNVDKNNYSDFDSRHLETIEHIQELMEEVAGGDVSNLEEAIAPFHLLLEEMLKEHNLLQTSRALHSHDELTYKHSVNVGFLSALIGKIIKVPDSLVGKLGEMGLFHDIGKLKINRELMMKNSLEISEEDEMQMHTIYGHELLQGKQGIYYLIPAAALLHHEACDGSGYPYGYTEAKIPFPVQIVTVADKYDRLCGSEVDGIKLSVLDAAERIKRDSFNGKLNPKIVLPFVEYLKQHFVHQTVTLSDGRVGEIVYFSNDELTKPLVRVGESFVDLKAETNLRVIG